MIQALFLLILIILPLQNLVASTETKEELVNGWYHWDPYQYRTTDRATGSQLTGLDIELTKEITAEAGHQVVYEPVEWKQHQLDLKEGKRDFASGATYTDARSEYAYFSKPYRYEENSLFLRRGDEGRLNFTSIKEFLDQVKAEKFRLGVIDGFIYADPQINDWLEDPKNQDLITRVTDDKKNIDLLLADKIDGFLADRIVGATELWRKKQGDKVNEVRLNIKTPIHFMFSKKSVPQAVVAEFDKAITKVMSTDEYSQLISWYLYPVLLLQTIDSTWFRIVEILGTIAFAISGLVIAFRDRSTLFGAFIFAVLPSIGGGMIRDIIFARHPVGAMQSPIYLLIVISTVIIGFIGIKIYQKYSHYYGTTGLSRQTQKAHVILMLCDALGLAAFTVSGIVVSVMAKATPLWLWGAFFAFLTGAGGGILRDALSKERDIVSLRGDIYPEIAVLWGALLSIFITFQSQSINPDPIRYAVFITVAGAFLTRVLVYYYKVPNIFFARGNTQETHNDNR